MAKCAQLREEFCLQGPTLERILPFRDKISAKIKLKKIEDKCLPKYIKFDCQEYKKDPINYCDTIAKTLHFPIFAKPIDLAGSVGSCKISDDKELKAWCKKNKDNNYMELDEFIEGKLYHCDSLVSDGKLIKVDIAAYLHPCAEFFNNKLCGSIDLLRTDPSWEKFAKFNEMILSELQPPDGVTHLEFFQTADDRLVFVECAARAPGGLIPEMRKNNYGIDINLAQYQLQMKIKTDYASEAKSYSAWAYIPRKYGILKEMIEPKDLSSKVELHWEFKVGEVMQPKDDVGEYTGKILLTNDDYEKLRQDFHEIDKHQFFTVQSLTAVKTSYTSSPTGVSKSATEKSGEKSEETVVQSGSELQNFYRSILTS